MVRTISIKFIKVEVAVVARYLPHTLSDLKNINIRVVAGIFEVDMQG